MNGYTNDKPIWPSRGEMMQAAKDNNTTLEAVMAAFAQHIGEGNSEIIPYITEFTECPECKGLSLNVEMGICEICNYVDKENEDEGV